MADDKALAASLILLFDGMEPAKIGEALHAAMPKVGERGKVISAWEQLSGEVSVYVLAASDILNAIKDEDEEYTGDRQHLNSVVTNHVVSDGIYDAMSHERDEIISLLREQGLLKEIEHDPTCKSKEPKHWPHDCDCSKREAMILPERDRRRLVCASCGSDDLSFRADATWNSAFNRFEASGDNMDHTWCVDCDSETDDVGVAFDYVHENKKLDETHG